MEFNCEANMARKTQYSIEGETKALVDLNMEPTRSCLQQAKMSGYMAAMGLWIMIESIYLEYWSWWIQRG